MPSINGGSGTVGGVGLTGFGFNKLIQLCLQTNTFPPLLFSGGSGGGGHSTGAAGAAGRGSYGCGGGGGGNSSAGGGTAGNGGNGGDGLIIIGAF